MKIWDKTVINELNNDYSEFVIEMSVLGIYNKNTREKRKIFTNKTKHICCQNNHKVNYSALVLSVLRKNGSYYNAALFDFFNRAPQLVSTCDKVISDSADIVFNYFIFYAFLSRDDGNPRRVN